jgi:DNA-directed RNA polymerase specialized sigma24 family protein
VSRQGEVTAILQAWSDDDERALDQLTPIVYDELRRLARRYMRQERPGHTLQTSALVNEAYLRLVDQTRTQCRTVRISSPCRRN